MAFFEEPSESDEDDEQVAEAAEDIVTHMIHVVLNSLEDTSSSTKSGSCHKSFSHLAHIDD